MLIQRLRPWPTSIQQWAVNRDAIYVPRDSNPSVHTTYTDPMPVQCWVSVADYGQTSLWCVVVPVIEHQHDIFNQCWFNLGSLYVTPLQLRTSTVLQRLSIEGDMQVKVARARAMPLAQAFNPKVGLKCWGISVRGLVLKKSEKNSDWPETHTSTHPHPFFFETTTKNNTKKT